jgi:hypothetical protein
MRDIHLSAFIFIALVANVYGETITAWNFNDAISGTTGGELEFSVDRGNGAMTSDFIPSNIGNAAGSTLNLEDGDFAGQALRLSSYANNGKNLTWMVSTAGHDSIGISFAIQRTSTGFSDNQFLYSVDSGVSWTTYGDPFNPGTSFALQSFDLSLIPELSDNPDAGFRILFGGATSSTGNNRIDNLIVTGNPAVPPVSIPVPEPSTVALTTTGLAGVFLVGKCKGLRKFHAFQK